MSVNDLIRSVLDSSDLSDPVDVAAEVARRVPSRDLRGALSEVLATYVRTQFSRTRLVEPDDAPTRSAKVAAVRDAWQHRLATPVKVGESWKRLGDCTADDLRAVAASLRALASRTAAKAVWYDALADALPAGGTVAMLSADTARAAA